MPILKGPKDQIPAGPLNWARQPFTESQYQHRRKTGEGQRGAWCSKCQAARTGHELGERGEERGQRTMEERSTTHRG